MLKRITAILALSVFVLLTGCNTAQDKDIEKAINGAFSARAEAVFKYKDKKPLTKYFSAQALKESQSFLEWSPKQPWTNVKNLKYSYSIRVANLKVNGKQAEAEVYDTAVVSWDFVDKARVTGPDIATEDAWANRRHDLILVQNTEGQWIIEQDKF